MTARDVAAELRRWEDSGAVWRVLEREGARLTLGLWTCTGDELVDRVETDDPEVLRLVGDRRSSEDAAP